MLSEVLAFTNTYSDSRESATHEHVMQMVMLNYNKSITKSLLKPKKCKLIAAEFSFHDVFFDSPSPEISLKATCVILPIIPYELR